MRAWRTGRRNWSRSFSCRSRIAIGSRVSSAGSNAPSASRGTVWRWALPAAARSSRVARRRLRMLAGVAAVAAVAGLGRTTFAAGCACRAGTQPASLGSTLVGASAFVFAAGLALAVVFVFGAAFVTAAGPAFVVGFALAAGLVFAAPALPVVLLFAVRVAIVVLPVSTLTRRLRARPE